MVKAFFGCVPPVPSSKRVPLFLAIFAFVVLTAGVMACAGFTSESENYCFANCLFDYKKGNRAPNTPTAVISKSGEYSYDDLYDHYHYSTEVKSFRMVCDEGIIASNDELKEPKRIKLVKQKTYTVGQKTEYGYNIDGGLFSAYYKDEVLGERGYLNVHPGCNGFVFLSDTFANALMADYGISTYQELITTPSFSELTFSTSEGKSLKLCINNIIYSNQKTGARVKEIYGDFGLAFLTNNDAIRGLFNWSVELDLKTDLFENHRLIPTLANMGYRSDGCALSFYTFDQDKGGIVPEKEISELAKTIHETTAADKVYPFLLLAYSLALSSLVFVFSTKSPGHFDWFFLSAGFAALLYFLVGFFVFISPTINFAPIISLVVSIIYLLIKLTKKLDPFSKRKRGLYSFYEI